MNAEALALSGLWVAIFSAVLAVASIVLAIIALHRGNRNASASMILTINETFRQAWVRVRSTSGGERTYELHELLNLIETVCAIQQEGSLSGVSRELVEDYLCEILAIIGRDLEARRTIATMRNAPTTFKYLRAFFAAMRKSGKALALEKISTGEISPNAQASAAVPTPAPAITTPVSAPAIAATTPPVKKTPRARSKASGKPTEGRKAAVAKPSEGKVKSGKDRGHGRSGGTAA